VTSRPRSQHAFSTIELLIAISILVILAGLVFVGLRSVSTGGKNRATRATLESASSLLTEVEVAKGMPYVKRVYTVKPVAAPSYFYAFSPLPKATTPSAPPDAPNPPRPTPVDAPLSASGNGNVSADVFAPGAHEIRYQSPAIVRTQLVMQRILNVSANRTTISQLPTNSFLTWAGGSTAPTLGPAGERFSFQTMPGTPVRYQPSPPVLVDGWGNPIIYVPPAGLRGVKFSDDPAVSRVVTSVRVRGDYNASSTTNPRAEDYYNFEPGATGFWASAGADGDFTKGDDNVYSFEGF
jgi:type II secretory pathway pseudopilin PulG